jgi:pSer/pThr/pTyr-binding forkhead associated (FHA) protein
MAHTYFVIKEPGEPDQVLVWDTRTLSIGRSPENDLVVEDEEVSRKHALLKNERGAMEVGDYRTGNGTFVNGNRVQQTARIQSGDVITLGKLQLELRHGDEHPAKLGIKLTYASHLKTVGNIPQMADGNSTMIGMLDDTQQADEPFVIQPDRSSGGQAFVLGDDAGKDLELDAPDDDLDDFSIEIGEGGSSPVIDLDAELDLMDSAEPPAAKPRAPKPASRPSAPASSAAKPASRPQAPAPHAPKPASRPQTPPSRAAAPASRAPAPAPDPNAQSGSDVLGRMQNLKALHDAGLITDAEFEAKRAEILKEV